MTDREGVAPSPASSRPEVRVASRETHIDLPSFTGLPDWLKERVQDPRIPSWLRPSESARLIRMQQEDSVYQSGTDSATPHIYRIEEVLELRNFRIPLRDTVQQSRDQTQVNQIQENISYTELSQEELMSLRTSNDPEQRKAAFQELVRRDREADARASTFDTPLSDLIGDNPTGKVIVPDYTPPQRQSGVSPENVVQNTPIDIEERTDGIVIDHSRASQTPSSKKLSDDVSVVENKEVERPYRDLTDREVADLLSSSDEKVRKAALAERSQRMGLGEKIVIDGVLNPVLDAVTAVRLRTGKFVERAAQPLVQAVTTEALHPARQTQSTEHLPPAENRGEKIRAFFWRPGPRAQELVPYRRNLDGVLERATRDDLKQALQGADERQRARIEVYLTHLQDDEPTQEVYVVGSSHTPLSQNPLRRVIAQSGQNLARGQAQPVLDSGIHPRETKTIEVLLSPAATINSPVPEVTSQVEEPAASEKPTAKLPAETLDALNGWESAHKERFVDLGAGQQEVQQLLDVLKKAESLHAFEEAVYSSIKQTYQERKQAAFDAAQHQQTAGNGKANGKNATAEQRNTQYDLVKNLAVGLGMSVVDDDLLIGKTVAEINRMQFPLQVRVMNVPQGVMLLEQELVDSIIKQVVTPGMVHTKNTTDMPYPDQPAVVYVDFASETQVINPLAKIQPRSKPVVTHLPEAGVVAPLSDVESRSASHPVDIPVGINIPAQHQILKTQIVDVLSQRVLQRAQIADSARPEQKEPVVVTPPELPPLAPVQYPIVRVEELQHNSQPVNTGATSAPENRVEEVHVVPVETIPVSQEEQSTIEVKGVTHDDLANLNMDYLEKLVQHKVQLQTATAMTEVERARQSQETVAMYDNNIAILKQWGVDGALPLLARRLTIMGVGLPQNDAEQNNEGIRHLIKVLRKIESTPPSQTQKESLEKVSLVSVDKTPVLQEVLTTRTAQPAEPETVLAVNPEVQEDVAYRDILPRLLEERATYYDHIANPSGGSPDSTLYVRLQHQAARAWIEEHTSDAAQLTQMLAKLKNEKHPLVTGIDDRELNICQKHIEALCHVYPSSEVSEAHGLYRHYMFNCMKSIHTIAYQAGAYQELASLVQYYQKMVEAMETIHNFTVYDEFKLIGKQLKDLPPNTVQRTTGQLSYTDSDGIISQVTATGLKSLDTLTTTYPALVVIKKPDRSQVSN